jgi:hypothetical protein
VDVGAALWLRNDCEYAGVIGSNGDFGTDGFQPTSEDLIVAIGTSISSLAHVTGRRQPRQIRRAARHSR